MPFTFLFYTPFAIWQTIRRSIHNLKCKCIINNSMVHFLYSDLHKKLPFQVDKKMEKFCCPMELSIVFFIVIMWNLKQESLRIKKKFKEHQLLASQNDELIFSLYHWTLESWEKFLSNFFKYRKSYISNLLLL